jgi:phosphatidylglycerol:prolipoprotein diacylglycerol transferase
VHPELQLGPLTLQTFGISFALAFLACGVLVARRLRELGRPADWAYEALFAAFAGGLVGARVDYLIQNRDSVEFPEAIYSGTGLVFFGGLVGGMIGVALWARWRDYVTWQLADMAGVAVALGYTIGRFGCQISGDGDYGVESDLPWAMAYPDGTVPEPDRVHPTPVYESLAMGLATLVLWRLRDRVRPGTLFALYLSLGGLERFLIEFIRRNEPVLVGLTVAQVFGLMSAGAGIALVARRKLRAPART